MNPVMVDLRKSGFIFFKLIFLFFFLFSEQGFGFQKNPHGNIKIPCSSCHVADNWKIMKSPMIFNHTSDTKFPLTGSHQNAQCSSCHAKLNFQIGTSTCQSCHEDIHKGTLGVNCETCHQTTTWSPLPHSKIMEIHNTGRFPLTGAHQTADCFGCHVKSGNGAIFRINNSLECIACHQMNYNTAKNPDHALLGFPVKCQDCHSTFSWVPASFNHDTFSFPLTGAHKSVLCESCHAGNKFKGTAKDCNSCHQKDFVKTTNPNHVAANFSTDCQTCHSTFSWKPASFDHNTTAFPLTGGHISTTCESCHKNNVFKGLNKTCFPCHQTDFNNVVSPNHVTAKFPVTCETCHTTLAWKPTSFDHDTFSFPLTGAHKTVSCESCHAGNVFKGTPKDCNSCHQKDFVKTTNPNHVAANFSTDCQTCHSTFSWKPASYDHNTTAFPLTGGHITATCSSCHKNDVFKGLSKNCYSCHQTDFNNVVSPNHVTGKFSTECQTCHTTTKWKPSTFNHSQTSFPLTGNHVTATCESCHKNGVFAGTGKTCVSCHQTNFDQSKNPNHFAAGFSTECQTCHSTFSWQPATFDHNTTAFPLTGGHISVTCSSCHKNDVFKGLNKTCYPCHQTDFNNVVTPNHVSAKFPVTCETCHSTLAWKPASFDHDTFSFPLTGAHKTVSCESCHAGNIFKGTPKDCNSCHQKDFVKTTNPNHSAAGFSTECQTCHSTFSWKPASFDHNTTAFPLTGGHISVTCSSCHKNDVFKGLNKTCYPCHQIDFQNVVNPNHVTAKFPVTCETCHTTLAWKPASFDHDTFSFPLTGAHKTVSCESCHAGNIFKGTPKDCNSCHQKDFVKTVNPNHTAANFSTDCQTCHSTFSWKPASFDHNTTAFPLTGGHISVTCSSCHKNDVFKGLSKNCYSCHQTDFNKVVSPNHVSGKFSTECQTCHTTTTWKPSTFNHSQTSFPLTGTHTTATCESCHKNGVFAGTSKTCVSCHQSNFDQSKNPNHIAAGFSTDCQTCHSTFSWQPASFDHNTTAFPLTGNHVSVTCNSCHKNDVFKGLAKTCYPCHQTDFQNVVSPNHVSGNFSTECQTCHTTSAWKPSTFDHNNTTFPLTGSHKTTTCESCHKNGVFKGTSKTCYPCHQSDFTKVTSPNHVSGKFPVTCETCHTTIAWKPSSFNHDGLYFPIYSGEHNGKWSTCAQCHQQPTNYKSFTCMSSGCHTQSNTNSQHSEVGGYTYSASACYSCHPKGKE